MQSQQTPQLGILKCPGTSRLFKNAIDNVITDVLKHGCHSKKAKFKWEKTEDKRLLSFSKARLNKTKTLYSVDELLSLE